MKKVLISTLYLGMVLAIVNGCTTIQKVTYTKSGSMAGLKNYAWLTDSPQIVGELRTDKWSVDSQIRRQIDNELASKSYVKTIKSKADFYINYKLSVLTQENILFSKEIGSSVEEMDKGSLAIEAIDPRSEMPIWRGEQKAKTYRYDFIESRLNLIKNSIRQILSNFP
ncbi:MAG: DUF4136 domain-containing protein [Candidatus Omnitrophota bacterium]|jgi:hypothetical protein